MDAEFNVVGGEHDDVVTSCSNNCSDSNPAAASAPSLMSCSQSPVDSISNVPTDCATETCEQASNGLLPAIDVSSVDTETCCNKLENAAICTAVCPTVSDSRKICSVDEVEVRESTSNEICDSDRQPLQLLSKGADVDHTDADKAETKETTITDQLTCNEQVSVDTASAVVTDSQSGGSASSGKHVAVALISETGSASADVLPVELEKSSHLDQNAVDNAESSVSVNNQIINVSANDLTEGDDVGCVGENAVLSAIKDHSEPQQSENDIDLSSSQFPLASCAGGADRLSTGFHCLDRAANVVIDLREPRLVQVCTLYGGTDDFNGESSGSGFSAPIQSPRRRQTAVRGKRRSSGATHEHFPETSSASVDIESFKTEVTSEDLPSSAVGVTTRRRSRQLPNQQENKHVVEHSQSADDTETIEEMNVGETLSSDQCISTNSGKHVVVSSEDRRSARPIRQLRARATSSPDSSDDESMRVRQVVHTYSRDALQIVRNRPSIQENVDESQKKKKSNDKRTSDAGSKTSQVKERHKKSDSESVSKPAMEHDNNVQVSEQNNSKNRSRSKRLSSEKLPHHSVIATAAAMTETGTKLKKRVRIGPAWFSRLHLKAPPRELWEYTRETVTFQLVKRANYADGRRHRPLAASKTSVPVSKRSLRVPEFERPDLSLIGCEQLTLWRMREEDISELNTQLLREAEHRRTEHAMPLIMQMTDDQIEEAYGQVAESMKTYDIIAVDSDNDDEVGDSEKEEEMPADDQENDAVELKFTDPFVQRNLVVEEHVTEYSRTRPKRLAVDYSPSAFAPILIMEGRRLFARGEKSEPRAQPGKRGCPHTQSSNLDKRRNSTHDKKRKKSSASCNDEDDDVPLKELATDNGLQLPAVKKGSCDTDRTLSSAGAASVLVGSRCGLFEVCQPVSSERGRGRSVPYSNQTDTGVNDSVSPTVQKSGARDESDASHLSASPPPDLGDPITAHDDQFGVTDPAEPPLLQPVLGRESSKASKKVVAQTPSVPTSIRSSAAENTVSPLANCELNACSTDIGTES